MSTTSQNSTVPGKALGRYDGDEAILVVEDDAGLLKLIEKILAAGGHRTVGVQTGAAALAWLRRNSPRLILLDYSLPDMRGEELVEQIQARGRRLPFIVATGHGNESVAVEMMKRGAYDYLVKSPSFMQLLPAVVDQALERAGQTQRLIQAEEQLREAHEDLEQRVLRRTAELAEANRRLRTEMEERRRAEEQVQQHQAELAHVARLSTVGEMVVELAHELNQPLSAISSYAQACLRLLDSGAEADRAELLNSLVRVGEQADRAAEILRRLRRFVAKAKPQQTVLDINALIADVVELTKIDMRRADVKVCRQLSADLPPIVGDRIQLEQVMVNLTRNACEAMQTCPAEDRLLSIRTSLDREKQICVEVSDRGAGIPPALLDRVFDRFFTTKPDGMGMGLAISRSIIHRHGGALSVSPNKDRGCTFYFTLPADSGDHDRGN